MAEKVSNNNLLKTISNNNLLKTLIYMAGALIAVGVFFATVSNNTDRIEKVEGKTEQHETDIVGLQKDIDYIKDGVDDIKLDLKTIKGD